MQTAPIQNPIQSAPFSQPTSFAGTQSANLNPTNLPTHRRCLVLKSPNKYEWCDLMIPPLQEHHVLVKVEASAISPLDTLCISGHGGLFGLGYSARPFTLGLEGTGVVVGAGGSAESQRLVGKRVSGLSFDGGWWGDYNVLRSDEVFALDEIGGTDIRIEEAASLALNPATAMMFLRIAQKHNVKAIVNTAASTVLGRQIFRLFSVNGIDVINIVRSNEKAADLRKEGALYVLIEDQGDFADSYMMLADRLGAQLVFDAVGGPLASMLLDLSPYGTKVYIYGLFSEKSQITVPIPCLFAGKSVKSALIFRYLASHTREENRQLFRDILANYRNVFQTNLLRAFPASEIKDALEIYEKHKHDSKGIDGKIVIEFFQYLFANNNRQVNNKE
eukprot:TRINITY_DN16494_c0_g1_i1.p1 TRINITY_DN16494_c0_g1~~TRINITY_DN16494_c0_g1_i1.p1  ORF type:complete len:389 (-),score=69.87 TRINITY_DN16494_c0_g1_i1:217-1383(-)